MNLMDTINSKMAMANLDIALDILKDLLDEECTPITDRNIEWARLCCTYSRCLHLNVWRDNTPSDKVRSEIIPLLEKAEKQVGQLEKRYAQEKEYASESQYYRTNIQLRKTNLSENFANGKPSEFPPDAIEPDMRTRPETIARLVKSRNTVKHTT